MSSIYYDECTVCYSIHMYLCRLNGFIFITIKGIFHILELSINFKCNRNIPSLFDKPLIIRFTKGFCKKIFISRYTFNVQLLYKHSTVLNLYRKSWIQVISNTEYSCFAIPCQETHLVKCIWYNKSFEVELLAKIFLDILSWHVKIKFFNKFYIK